MIMPDLLKNPSHNYYNYKILKQLRNEVNTDLNKLTMPTIIIYLMLYTS